MCVLKIAYSRVGAIFAIKGKNQEGPKRDLLCEPDVQV